MRNNLDIKKALNNYGLSENEASVYLAVLSLGSSTIREISNATKIKRTTVYLIADKLSLEQYSSEVLYIGSAKELNDIISENYVTERYIPTRIKRKIKFTQIVFRDNFSLESTSRDLAELRQTKFLPSSCDFVGNMLIYQNKVAYFSSRKELSCVLIESNDISEMERKKFELLWGKL